jgi:hypothetical protein
MLVDTGKISNIDAAPDGYESPFCTAVRLRKLNIARFLLEQNADVNRHFNSGYNLYADSGSKITVLGHLLYSVGGSALACIRFLLESGKASMFTDPEETTTVLHNLATKTNPSEREIASVVRRAFHLLNSHFRFTQDQLDLRNRTGTALEYAVQTCKAVVVDELLRAGASWDIHAPERSSALQLALKHLYFFPHGFEPEGKFPSKERQLHEAFERRRSIALLISRKALDKCREPKKEEFEASLGSPVSPPYNLALIQ